MSKKVTFYLGPASGLSKRQLTITRMPKAGDDDTPSATVNATLGATTTITTQTLPDNQIWQAKLVDTKTSGEVSDPDILNFHTGSLQFPGPRSPDRLSILSMEDMSSSSSCSSTSSGSSSSCSSTSCSSTSSGSSSSCSSTSSSCSESAGNESSSCSSVSSSCSSSVSSSCSSGL